MLLLLFFFFNFSNFLSLLPPYFHLHTYFLLFFFFFLPPAPTHAWADRNTAGYARRTLRPFLRPAGGPNLTLATAPLFTYSIYSRHTCYFRLASSTAYWQTYAHRFAQLRITMYMICLPMTRWRTRWRTRWQTGTQHTQLGEKKQKNLNRGPTSRSSVLRLEPIPEENKYSRKLKDPSTTRISLSLETRLFFRRLSMSLFLFLSLYFSPYLLEKTLSPYAVQYSTV